MSEITTPWSTVGYLTYKRTYSRPMEGTTQTEEFKDTVERVLTAAREQLGVGFTDDEEDRMREYILKLKCSLKFFGHTRCRN